jgi:predicted DNA-binding WGR domain protein
MDERGLIERAYLEFRDGSSSKFYAVARVAHHDGTQSVSFNFGRIGFPRAWDDRARHVEAEVARTVYASLLGEKRRKGYQDGSWPESLAGPDEAVDPLAPPFVASTAGSLPGVGRATVAGIGLPSGHPLSPGSFAGATTANPTLWLTDALIAKVGELWIRLAGEFPATGLWPLVIDNPELEEVLSDWASPSGRPVAEILEAAWDASFEDAEEGNDELSPFTRGFPKTAGPTTGALDPTSYATVVRELEGHLGLVPATRPADAVAAIGWQGWANYDSDPSEMATVFRSWEERFGAVLVGLSFDVLTFAVARPARNLGEAIAIAAEHTAICPDNVWQGAGTLRDYARGLVQARAWTFWWD